ncbi:MAG TPA: CcmD family protein [Spirochaetota bacterium]|nr:CcmD family protein [Spirochaetota bacterium]HOF14181.1 CcmD family protein [Spirochaetota bacterium]HOM88098.1 CcmD family protein [Spirochaetota bacterium]HOR93592.1 CcmD family protein [Spirochaetota bacterium]HOT20699.1 CcmD family protein [Spirochaetota bacterium]
MKLYAIVTAMHFLAQTDSNYSKTLFWVSAVVWCGIVCYLVVLHRKIKQLEKRVNGKK